LAALFAVYQDLRALVSIDDLSRLLGSGISTVKPPDEAAFWAATASSAAF
jgi:hypothetical protein